MAAYMQALQLVYAHNYESRMKVPNILREAPPFKGNGTLQQRMQQRLSAWEREYAQVRRSEGRVDARLFSSTAAQRVYPHGHCSALLCLSLCTMSGNDRQWAGCMACGVADRCGRGRCPRCARRCPSKRLGSCDSKREPVRRLLLLLLFFLFFFGLRVNSEVVPRIHTAQTTVEAPHHRRSLRL